jgi:hypothetical protein
VSQKNFSQAWGSAWPTTSKTRLSSSDKTQVGIGYQFEGSFYFQGTITPGEFPKPYSPDPFSDAWYTIANSKMAGILQQIKNNFEAQTKQGCKVQYMHIDYSITWRESYIPTGARTFFATGNKIIQFADVTHPFGIDDLTFLLMIVVLGALGISIAAAVIYSLGQQIISTAGPVGSILLMGLVGVAAIVGVGTLLGARVKVRGKGRSIEYRGRRKGRR